MGSHQGGVSREIPAVADANLRQISVNERDGREDKDIFVRHVEETEGVVIMGPSEHN